jgi:hypothetical protein
MQVADIDPVTLRRVPTEQPSPRARLSPLSRVSQVEMLLIPEPDSRMRWISHMHEALTRTFLQLTEVYRFTPPKSHKVTRCTGVPHQRI